ncbi:MAG: hypothetical protein L0154_30305 [Chloroflexi bacterium]|nr:hypothetical protein [Chloroflexota bacterium]
MEQNITEQNGFTETQLQALIEHYENARMDGLCHEGAWEVALSHLHDLHISPATLTQLEAILRG